MTVPVRMLTAEASNSSSRRLQTATGTNSLGRQVFWLSARNGPGPPSRLRSGKVGPGPGRSQRRPRDGIAPSSLFVPCPGRGAGTCRVEQHHTGRRENGQPLAGYPGLAKPQPGLYSGRPRGSKHSSPEGDWNKAPGERGSASEPGVAGARPPGTPASQSLSRGFIPVAEAAPNPVCLEPVRATGVKPRVSEARRASPG